MGTGQELFEKKMVYECLKKRNALSVSRRSQKQELMAEVLLLYADAAHWRSQSCDEPLDRARGPMGPGHL